MRTFAFAGGNAVLSPISFDNGLMVKAADGTNAADTVRMLLDTSVEKSVVPEKNVSVVSSKSALVKSLTSTLKFAAASVGA